MFDSKNAKRFVSQDQSALRCQTFIITDQPGSKLVKNLKSKGQKENSQFVLFTKLTRQINFTH